MVTRRQPDLHVLPDQSPAHTGCSGWSVESGSSSRLWSSCRSKRISSTQGSRHLSLWPVARSG